MKKFLFFISLLTLQISAQTEYVNINNPVYNFLERMEALQIVENYNNFEIPKTRKEIALYIKEVIAKKISLMKLIKIF